MIILLIGPSGSGKGTQAQLLAKKLHLPAISMGQLLRDEISSHSSLGQQVKSYLDQGLWAPSQLTFEVLKPVLDQHPEGFILDGFPRLLDQLKILEQHLQTHHKSIDKIFYLQVSDQESINRLLKRAQLLNRHDDTQAIIKQRLQSFHASVDPILDYAQQRGYLEQVNGERSIAAIHQDIISRLPQA